MHPFINGLFFGLTLTVLLGPIFFALIQAGLERGFRAGLAMGIGIWVSDILFIVAVYKGVSHIVAITQIEGFELWVGIAGGIILLLIGLLTLLSKPPKMEIIKQSKKKQTASYLVLWVKGFLINTINPFTFFFWISVMTAVVLKNEYSFQESGQFFTGIILVIVFTDLLKVYLAKFISSKLKPIHILWMRRVSGGALVAFGIILIVRVLWMT